MNLLTRAEVHQFLTGLWDIDLGGFYAAQDIRAVTLFDMTPHQAKSHVASFLATINREIDPDSITITEDGFDDSPKPVTTITFRIQHEAPRNA